MSFYGYTPQATDYSGLTRIAENVGAAANNVGHQLNERKLDDELETKSKSLQDGFLATCEGAGINMDEAKRAAIGFYGVYPGESREKRTERLVAGDAKAKEWFETRVAEARRKKAYTSLMGELSTDLDPAPSVAAPTVGSASMSVPNSLSGASPSATSSGAAGAVSPTGGQFETSQSPYEKYTSPEEYDSDEYRSERLRQAAANLPFLERGMEGRPEADTPARPSQQVGSLGLSSSQPQDAVADQPDTAPSARPSQRVGTPDLPSGQPQGQDAKVRRIWLKILQAYPNIGKEYAEQLLGFVKNMADIGKAEREIEAAADKMIQQQEHDLEKQRREHEFKAGEGDKDRAAKAAADGKKGGSQSNAQQANMDRAHKDLIAHDDKMNQLSRHINSYGQKEVTVGNTTYKATGRWSDINDALQAWHRLAGERDNFVTKFSTANRAVGGTYDIPNAPESPYVDKNAHDEWLNDRKKKAAKQKSEGEAADWNTFIDKYWGRAYRAEALKKIKDVDSVRTMYRNAKDKEEALKKIGFEIWKGGIQSPTKPKPKPNNNKRASAASGGGYNPQAPYGEGAGFGGYLV